jgi:hypothetical protein
MTIPLEKLKEEWLADPEVKREYDALAPEFDALAESIRPKLAKKSKRQASRRILKLDRHAPAER